jgi:hypothetical protein
MIIGEVRPQDPSEHLQGHSPSDTTQPTQEPDQDQEMTHGEHEDEDEHNDQAQEESNDQGGDEDDGDKQESNSKAKPPHPRVRHTIQRDHPLNNILGDIKKGVATRSCVAIFVNITCSFLPLIFSR